MSSRHGRLRFRARLAQPASPIWLVDLGSGFSLRGYGDIGGFGVSSDLTYQIYGGVGYRFKEWFSAELGYRVLDVDYDDDGFVYDLTMHGPMAGFRFQF